MPEAIVVAAALYGLTPMECLVASTCTPAWILGLERTHGTLAAGRRADLVVLDGDAFRQVPYRPGHDPVVHTYVAGERIGGR
jgi:imidazolonepropionase-like amidohydrolase